MGATPAIFYLTEHIIRDKVKFSLHVNGFNQLNRPKLLCKKGATLIILGKTTFKTFQRFFKKVLFEKKNDLLIETMSIYNTR